MKIVVINGNRETNNDNTTPVLTPFLDGMREAGAEVALFHTEKLKIKPCRGCNMCLHKTPGECYQRDDMKRVLTELSQAEVWVFATLPAADGLTAPMERVVARMLPLTKPTGKAGRNPTWSLKTLVKRLRPSTEPTADMRDDRTREPLRNATTAGKLVLVSGCDSRELEDFDPLVQRMRSIAQTHKKEFAGAVLRPRAGAMGPPSKASSALDDFATAAYRAGRQLVLSGTLRPETLAVVHGETLTRGTSPSFSIEVRSRVPVAASQPSE